MHFSSSLIVALLLGAAYAAPVATEDVSTPQATFEELFASASAIASAALASSTGSCTAAKVVVRKEWYVLLS